MLKQAATIEGLLVGISTGAALSAINNAITDIPEQCTIITYAYDNEGRYLGVGRWREIETVRNPLARDLVTIWQCLSPGINLVRMPRPKNRGHTSSCFAQLISGQNKACAFCIFWCNSTA